MYYIYIVSLSKFTICQLDTMTTILVINHDIVNHSSYLADRYTYYVDTRYPGLLVERGDQNLPGP